MATATKSYGTTASIGGTSIGGLRGASHSGNEINNIPTTAWDSGGWAEYIGGVKDGGTIELSGISDPSDSGQASLISDFGEIEEIVITRTDGRTITADVIVGGYNTEIGEDDAVLFTCSCKVTGQVVFGGSGG